MQTIVLTVSLLLCNHIISLEHWEHKYPLHSAAYRENTEVIIALLNKGANINAQDDDGNTPLHKATRNKAIALLIQHGANVYIKNNKGRTPLEQAVNRNIFAAQGIIQYGFLFGNYSLDDVQTILHTYHAQLDYSLTSLYRHVESQYNRHKRIIDNIKFYLRRFSEPTDRPNKTYKIMNERKLRKYEGYQKQYRQLLPLNPEKNYHSRKKLRLLQKDRNELPEIEFPSLQILCTSFLARLPHHIINAASPSMLTRTRISPHRQALGLQLTETINNERLSHGYKLLKIRELIDQGADVNTPDYYYSLAPLQSAIFNKNTEIAQLLIQAGADINIKTKRDCTLLHIATCSNYIEIIPLLLQAGVDIDAQDDHGDTALHDALSHKNNAIAQLLIKAHTNLHIQARLDHTPLCTAVSNENIEIIPLLLQAGADIDANYLSGMTPLYLAICKNNIDIARLLINAHAKINYQHHSTTPLHAAVEHKNTKMAQLLLQSGAHIHAQNKNGNTPLHTAAEYEYPEIISLLLQADAKIDAQNYMGKTPLDIATSKKNTAFVQLLLQAGAHINAQDNNLNTPLHTATEHECPEMISLLLQEGADIDAQNKNGHTSFNIAINKNNWEMAKSIMQNGFLYGRYTLQEIEDKITQYPQLQFDLTQLSDYASAHYTKLLQRQHAAINTFLSYLKMYYFQEENLPTDTSSYISITKENAEYKKHCKNLSHNLSRFPTHRDLNTLNIAHDVPSLKLLCADFISQNRK